MWYPQDCISTWLQQPPGTAIPPGASVAGQQQQLSCGSRQDSPSRGSTAGAGQCWWHRGQGCGLQAWAEAAGLHGQQALFKKAIYPSSLHSSHAEGKIAVCEEGVIPLLVSLLEDTQPEVQVNTTGALMFAAVTPQGERQRQFCRGTC